MVCVFGWFPGSPVLLDLMTVSNTCLYIYIPLSRISFSLVRVSLLVIFPGYLKVVCPAVLGYISYLD
jgi:hypothetical protein